MNRISHPFGNPWSGIVTLLPLYGSLVHHVFLLDCQRVPLNSQNTFVEKILTRQHRSSRQHFVMDHELLQTGPISRGARGLEGSETSQFAGWSALFFEMVPRAREATAAANRYSSVKSADFAPQCRRFAASGPPGAIVCPCWGSELLP